MPNNPQVRDEIFARAVRGNREALVFLHAIFEAADLGDDLHDADNGPVDVATMLRNVTMAHVNQFYKQHADALSALMLLGILSWDMSNKELREHPEAQVYAEQLEQVLFYVAMVCGGWDHARAIALEWINAGRGVDHGLG